jgi:UDP-arabinose 4-epimerase
VSETILVTGGSGFIGSHTCKALAKAGFIPITFDDLRRGRRDAVRWGPLVEGDVRDTKRLADCMREHRPAAVIHFAALAYVGESTEEPLAYYGANLAGTISLLDAMREAGVGRLVFSSTCATYGIPDALPITESAPQRPINPYGRSKLMCEEVIRDVARTGAISAVILRYFNAAGADPEGEIGEDHDPETHVIPLMLKAARAGAEPVTIFGEQHPTPDGTCVRDYVHVSDLADAHVKAVFMNPTSGVASFNLGTGQGVSLRDLLRGCGEVTGHPVPFVVAGPRTGDPPILVADAAAARRELGWTPMHSGIDEILRTAHAWLSKR